MPPAFAPVVNPEVSIVVPVYNHLDQTRRCLHSVAAVGSRHTFEVIVVDDGSTDASAQWLAECPNLRLHRMPDNRGFIAACNAGARIANGRYLVFLNNDTEVRQGWLDALLACFASIPDCGLVGAKLIGADGKLQEAGAVVFRDGRALNYGRGGDPADTRYDFVRETDYCSGACIAVPMALFRRLGGFDSRYAPAYYEDTDLAFAVRAAGYRVVYQPRAEVVHAEGATSGTDENVGVKRYQRINREKFVSKWQTALAVRPDAAKFARAPEKYGADRNRSLRVLVVDIDYPRPDRDSGSMRMFNILLLMRELGCHVQFWAMDARVRDSYARALEDRGIEIVLAPTPLQGLRWWHRYGAGVDVVWLSRVPAAVRHLRFARRHAAGARTVFDTVDLHFLRLEREAALQDDAMALEQARQLRCIELGAVGSADVTLVVSDHERALLKELTPTADVRILSNIHAVSGHHVPFQDRESLLFLGNFEHAPNVDAARWLAADIMPRLRRILPGATLHIVGYASDRVVPDLAGDGVNVDGFVANLEPLLDQVRVALAPLRFGAGVKGKINLAMSYGIPVVTTTIGAEGMALRNGFDAIVADDADAFADAVAGVYHDESLWARLAEHGRDNVRQHFSLNAAQAVLAELLAVGTSGPGPSTSYAN